MKVQKVFMALALILIGINNAIAQSREDFFGTWSVAKMVIDGKEVGYETQPIDTIVFTSDNYVRSMGGSPGPVYKTVGIWDYKDGLLNLHDQSSESGSLFGAHPIQCKLENDMLVFTAKMETLQSDFNRADSSPVLITYYKRIPK